MTARISKLAQHTSEQLPKKVAQKAKTFCPNGLSLFSTQAKQIAITIKKKIPKNDSVNPAGLSCILNPHFSSLKIARNWPRIAFFVPLYPEPMENRQKRKRKTITRHFGAYLKPVLFVSRARRRWLRLRLFLFADNFTPRFGQILRLKMKRDR